ncbi:hypothetical protein [Streptomyces sp. HNM0574]|uniref:hypothetical protein n=1 Tax=Streptomyces sp. HNM0574 TaxID=2714954 RepID=UPI00146F69D8|nr:hypothetical protein [Streptomyces sp. HNM0574]NLU67535.1 hypothetical protein [Streptomyces sp. HNM0574]
MHDTSPLPLLFLDVDGPLNPFAGPRLGRLRLGPRGYTRYRFRPPGLVARHATLPPGRVPELRVRLRPAHGPQLAALPFTLVWATAWAEDANACVGPVLGLPSLPVVAWPERIEPEIDGLHWKTRSLVAHAAGRPFAWVDDGITRRERRFIAAHHPGPALPYHVDPRHGLRDHDFATLATWARTHTPPPRPPRG